MSDKPITTHEYRGCTIEIHHDDSAECPRSWHDHETVMACWHRRYNLGDVQPSLRPDEYIKSEIPDGSIVRPLYLYDHSGITMSLGRFSCPWDSGRVGIIWLSLEAARKAWCPNRPNVTWDSYIKWGDKAITMREAANLVIEGDVETYDQFISGEVFGYVAKDSSGDHIDSCFGFYGHGEVKWDSEHAKCGYAMQCVRELIDDHLSKVEALAAATTEAEVWP